MIFVKIRTRPTRPGGLVGLFSSLFFVFLLIFFLTLLFLCLMTSCVYNPEKNVSQKKKENNVSGSAGSQDFVIVLGGNGSGEASIVLNQNLVLSSNQTSNETRKQDWNQSQDNVTGQDNTNETFQDSKMSALRSTVEFYFLLKRKSYFRHILGEGEQRTYNMSGHLVTIKPIIIASEEVKFRINNYTTKTLREDDYDGTQEFEIIVKDIYYRP